MGHMPVPWVAGDIMNPVEQEHCAAPSSDGFSVTEKLGVDLHQVQENMRTNPDWIQVYLMRHLAEVFGSGVVYRKPLKSP